MTTPQTKTTPPTQRKKQPYILATIFLTLGLLIGWFIIQYNNGKLPTSTPQYKGFVLQSPTRISNFTLTHAQTGQPLSLADLRGNPTLIYFGYTFCPDICPATLAEIKKAKTLLGDKAEQLQVVMITVDPERDTAETLTQYLTYFDNTFIGLTGTEQEILAATTPFGIFYDKHEGTPATGYLVDHTASVMLIDADGYLRIMYPFGMTATDMANDLQHFTKNNWFNFN